MRKRANGGLSTNIAHDCINEVPWYFFIQHAFEQGMHRTHTVCTTHTAQGVALMDVRVRAGCVFL